ncbi:MAG: tripartite tricarboxylate transporter TctB family protein [Paracoccaceae bacterium]
MALDRWLALIILLISLIYGYTAFFTMDGSLPPILQRNPIWPSTFPKILSSLAGVTALAIVLGLEKGDLEAGQQDIDYRRIFEYKIGQALIMLALMVAYALLLRTAGFLISTFGFLFIGGAVLGERRYVVLAIIALTAVGAVWYLVQQVLGIFLRPWPFFLG